MSKLQKGVKYSGEIRKTRVSAEREEWDDGFTIVRMAISCNVLSYALLTIINVRVHCME